MDEALSAAVFRSSGMQCPDFERAWHPAMERMLDVSMMDDQYPRWLCGWCGIEGFETPTGFEMVRGS